MLERFLELEKYLPGVIRKCQKGLFPAPLTHSQIDTLQELVEIMRPVESVIREISGSHYSTCSVIIRIVSCLTKSIRAMKLLTDEGIMFQNKLLEKINEKFANVEDHKLLAISTILDPRFKKLHFDHALAVSHAVERINKEMKSMGIEDSEKKKASIYKSEDPKRFSLWRSHDELVAKTTDEATKDEHLNDKLRQYLKEQPIPRHDDPFKHWQSLRPAFPTVYEVAMPYISIISSSVPSERIFSEAGYIKTLERNRLTGEHVNHLLFLGDLPREEWDFS
ncbi:zinc finger BED domain-containing protein 4-like [Diachasma alloeum]|uniref:zinc finger BED domain-containing protein 4-like n=1 Tax=Diachasma alloeum TaxID=454923 RepID=UPI0010FB8DDF|nr:zinc finger BED domain-containing protein 4-like [Diachasma alloeum]